MQESPDGAALQGEMRVRSKKMNLREAQAHLLRWHNSYSCLPAVLELEQAMVRDEWIALVGDQWTGFDNVGQHRLQLRNLLGDQGPLPALMTAAELDAYNELPERVTVFRGCSSRNLLGASWSLERDVAARFPYLNRYATPEPKLVTGTVSKKRVLALKLDRSEVEVISFSVRRTSIESLPAPQRS